ncbi:DUF5050 domain-containing protein [Anaerofustis butyriciformans]|uniref:DUF5050 domain-containing protein n=1 Tax=Anaerofustis butyriciformans TaxID=3108533 RepID=UPI003F8A75AA
MKKKIIIIMVLLVMVFVSGCSSKNIADYSLNLNKDEIINDYHKTFISLDKNTKYFASAVSLYKIQDSNLFSLGEKYCDYIAVYNNELYFTSVLNDPADVVALCKVDETKKQSVVKENVYDFFISQNVLYEYEYEYDKNTLKITSLKDDIKYTIPNVYKDKFIMENKKIYYLSTENDVYSINCYDIKTNTTKEIIKESSFDKGMRFEDFNVYNDNVYFIMGNKQHKDFYKFDLHLKKYSYMNTMNTKGEYYKCYYTKENIYYISKDEDNFYIYKVNDNKADIFTTLSIKYGTMGIDLNMLYIDNSNILVNLKLETQNDHIILFDGNGSLVEGADKNFFKVK